ncbi:DUF5979 domain-containing protein [Staphylococcus chromogenes]|nr:DUF5979 domain-containing protein [Staphylococcus chromogenes]
MKFANNTQTSRWMARRLFAGLLCAILALAGIAVPNSPFENELPQADAQTAPNTSDHLFGGCAYHSSTSKEILNDDLCWLDFSGVNFPRADFGAAPYKYSRQIGRYTLTMDITAESISLTGIREAQTTQILEARKTSAYAGTWGNTSTLIPYYDYYVAYADDATNPVIAKKGGNTRTYVNFTNIQLTENGKPVPNWRMFMADAEQTTSAETLSFDDRNSSTAINFVRRVTPGGWNDGCNRLQTPGTDVDPNGSRPVDIQCQNVGVSAPVGSFLASSLNPKSITTGFISSTNEAAAFAIAMGRTGGTVSSETAFEQAATGQHSTFDFKMYSRVGSTDTEIPNPNNDKFVPNVRPYDQNTWKPTDSQVFKSTASGAQATKALSRYQPVWTCTQGNNAQIIITEGQPVPAGFTLKNDAAAGTSEVAATNTANAPLTCNVLWKERFTASSLKIGKTVTGTGELSDAVAGKEFTINYQCQDPGTTVKFVDAYSTPLTGSVQVKSGETAPAIVGLPATSNCTITETQFPKPPGQSLETTYSKSNQLSLVPGENTVGVVNKYDLKTATLNVTKTLEGSAFAELEASKEYKFEAVCPSVKFDVPFTLTVNRSGGTATGTASIPNVPIGVDCYLKPLTGLNPEQSKYIKFDDRVVTFNQANVAKDESGFYHFTIPDEATPKADLNIVAKYSYQLRDLKVIKELAGPAAGSPTLVGKTFPVQYSCTTPDKTTPEKENPTGTLNIKIAAPNETPAAIPQLPVNSTCLIWEQDTPPVTNLQLKQTQLIYGDSNDVVEILDNADAKSQPIAKVDTSTDPNMNKVIVRNSYDFQLGQVNLQKTVTENGLSNLPTEYKLIYECGTRSVQRANGTVVSVPLQGTVTISGGQVKPLVMEGVDDELAKLLNNQTDASGAASLGVPYGNICKFSEETPTIAQAGVIWTSDVASQAVKVSQPANTQVVNNNFAAAGKGLTITSTVSKGASLAEDITYSLSCTNNDQPISLQPTDASFTLSASNPTHQIPASSLPKGSVCNLTETSTDSGQRAATWDPNKQEKFSINRSVDATVPNLNGGASTNFLLPQKVALQGITIDDATVVRLDTQYTVPEQVISARKLVTFDEATKQYITAERQQIKRERKFNITLVCTSPVDGTVTTHSGQISSVTGDFTVSDVPVGSSCTISEGDSTTAAGIDLKRSITIAGKTTDISQQFVVGNAATNIDVTNKYTRRTASVQLNKQAFLPGNIDGSKINNYFTHTFTMTCYDPETVINGQEAPLGGSFTATITGPGQATFEGVPVGVDCRIVGDKFGQLDISDTDSDGVQLKAHLKPKFVDWVVDNNDGTTFRDEEVLNGTTTSQMFVTKDNEQGVQNNVVDLRNHYDYVKTTMTLNKKVIGKPGDLALIKPDQLYDFNYTCRGVGYTYTSSGSGGAAPQVTQEQFSKIGTDADGNDIYDFTFPTTPLPTDAYCTLKESRPAGLPQDLDLAIRSPLIEGWKAEENGQSGYVPATEYTGPDPQITVPFENVYTRRMVPVRLQNMVDGYVVDWGEDPSDPNFPRTFELNVTCDDPSATTRQVSYTIPQSDAVGSVADQAPPTTGQTVDLPVGASCTLDMSKSTALNARSTLMMTAGDRKPYTEFAVWKDGVAQPGNPTERPIRLDPSTITQDLKSYKYSFNLPSDAQVSDRTGVAMTIGAETVYRRDLVDITFVKKAFGSIPADTTFEFYSSCLQGELFTLKAGESQVFPRVPVETVCFVQEDSDGVNDNAAPTDPNDPSTKPHAKIGVESVGQNIDLNPELDVINFPGDSENPPVYEWGFGIWPVLEPTDPGTPADWTLVATNSYPSVTIDKKIDGSPLSAVTGAVAGTAILGTNVDKMTMRYKITNNGGLEESNLKLIDPTLAGMTITANGTQYVVPADGVLDPNICGTQDRILKAGETLDCAFDVAIPGDPSSYFKYDGKEVTVQATTEAGVATATSAYDAIRLPASISQMLPQTGMQALVWALLLGLVALAIGLWRYLRTKEEESEDEEYLTDNSHDLE